MKKGFAFLLALLLLVSLPVAQRTQAEDTTVRVLLGTDGQEEITVTVKGTYAVGDTSFTDGTLTAKINNGTITVSHSEKGTLATSKESVRVVRAEADKDAANLTLFNKDRKATLTYLGDLVFYNEDGTMRVVNYVGMREYLYGVVSGEVTASSHEQLLKAEAICAKGFALAEVGARTKKYFDVYDSTTSQLYYGYKAADTTVIAAVDEVWQNTLLYKGNVVKTYYCTANGGQAVTPTIHWGNANTTEGAYFYGYDPFDLAGSSKNATVTLNGAKPSELPEKVYAYFVSLAESALGEPVESIESVVSLYGLYDAKKPSGSDRYPKDLAPHAESYITLNVKTKAGTYTQTKATFTLGDLAKKAGISASGDVFFTVRTGVQKWVLAFGANSGHRVGLSHRGAGQMAKQGYSYVDILKFYYRGADLVDANGSVIPSTADFNFAYEGPDPEATPVPSVEPTDTPEPTETPKPTPETRKRRNRPKRLRRRRRRNRPKRPRPPTRPNRDSRKWVTWTGKTASPKPTRCWSCGMSSGSKR
ncbi:MAG: SpoIID/LytB domain-containing protein [Clostridia bacterium]|nr:SpoIID/LytB domain-containing protein [Clostridia bacterium]